MSNLKEIFTPQIISHLKNNKNLITSELLQEIRSFGNEGKQLALDILDTEKDQENHYLDAFGNRLTYDGNRSLKKPYTKMNLAPIHLEEIEKCMNNIHYYKDNYVKIRTKSGVNFPDVRGYQNEFIDLLNDDNEESIVGLMGRQSSKSISTSIYLSHLYTFDKEKNIGIVANKGSLAREFLSNVKNIIMELPIWMQTGTKTWNKSFIEAENNMRVLTDVPTENAFRGFSIHCAVIDEAAFVRSTQWHLFLDAFLPSQSALSWKKNLILSTPKGMNHFYEIVKGASPTEFNSSGSGIKERGDTGFTLFKVDWRDVPRYDSKGNNISPEDFRDKIIRKHGAQYWAQNFACEFLGSSHTLIKSDILKEMNSKEPEEIRDGKLKIYSYPEKGHKYIFTVDPSMGIQGDFFAIQIIDITTINFKQVASARLNEDYLKLPIFLNDWGRYYNDALMIIENNTGSGQSIADILFQTFEYENLYFDKESKDKKRKKYPGFRTTTKSRKMILDNLKMFIENRKFEINDKDTIKEFFTFILINDKFQADEGFHDDMIMSLALCFAIFMDTNNFDDISKIIESMYNDEMQNDNFSDYLTIGNFDDGTEIEIQNKSYIFNGMTVEIEDGFY